MKRRDLIKKLENNGWFLARHGSEHDIYTNGTCSEAIPRHREINQKLAEQILKRAGL